MSEGRSRTGGRQTAYLRTLLGLAAGAAILGGGRVAWRAARPAGGHRGARPLGAAILGGAWFAWRQTRTSGDHRVARLVAASPFGNVRPGVGYVGDAACARCHPAIVESYRAHPMGRSVAPAAAATGDGPGAAPP